MTRPKGRTGVRTDAEKGQALLQKQREDAQRQADEDFRTVMSMPHGRRFLMGLVHGLCGLESVSFTGNSETFYREGRRSIARDLVREARRVCPELYVEAVAEATMAEHQRLKKRQAIEDFSSREDTTP